MQSSFWIGHIHFLEYTPGMVPKDQIWPLVGGGECTPLLWGLLYTLDHHLHHVLNLFHLFVFF